MSTAQTRRQREDLLDALPPCDVPAEKAVLGSAILEGSTFDAVAEIVGVPDFYGDKNAILFRNLLELRSEGLPVDDAVLLKDRLKQEAAWEDDREAAAYIAEVAGSVPYASNAAYYARIVRDKAQLRAIANLCWDTVRQCYDRAANPTELVEVLAGLVREMEGWGQ